RFRLGGQDAVHGCSTGSPRRCCGCAPVRRIETLRINRDTMLISIVHQNRPAIVAPQNAATYATLREIEGRLKSIKNIEKITKTMKIVASTKLTRAQRAMTESRTYGQTSNTVFEKAETKPLDKEGKELLI